jgi:hypothetical protein
MPVCAAATPGGQSEGSVSGSEMHCTALSTVPFCLKYSGRYDGGCSQRVCIVVALERGTLKYTDDRIEL